MTTRDLGISLQDELGRREKLIEQLTSECAAIRTTLGILERPSPEALNRVTKVVSRRNTPPKTKTESNGKVAQCEKHPGSTLNTKGECTKCAQRANYDRWRDKKKAPTETEDTVDMVVADRKRAEAKPNGDGPVLVRCDECGDRFQNVKDVGIHKSRVHFGTSSSHGSSLSGAI